MVYEGAAMLRYTCIACLVVTRFYKNIRKRQRLERVSNPRRVDHTKVAQQVYSWQCATHETPPPVFRLYRKLDATKRKTGSVRVT
jgi:hypothetical protein